MRCVCGVQVLPQMLTHLDINSEDPTAPDFDCVAVYSCSASCSLEALVSTHDTAYVEEFVWVQPSST